MTRILGRATRLPNNWPAEWERFVEQARGAAAAWIDEYNTTRRHSTNGMLSPLAYEHARATDQQPGHADASPGRQVA